MASSYLTERALPAELPLPAIGDVRDAFRLTARPGDARPGDALPGDARLAQLLAGEIIPRLMAGRSRVDHPAAVLPADVAAVTELALAVEADELLAYTEALLARGTVVETLLVELLAPAARLLGERWVDDRCTFVDVTMGLWRLQEVMHELSTRRPPTPDWGWSRRALFAPIPDEQHGFGSVIVEQVFARAGWTTDRLDAPTLGDLCAAVAGTHYDLIGLTVSCDCHIPALPGLVAGLRRASCHGGLRVMLGGRVLANEPALADMAGADGTASDARTALTIADALVGGAVRAAA